jgi:hypothetical protein
MTMPNSYLYQRQTIENDREKRLKDERMADYKKKAEEAARKQHNKEGKKDPVKEVKKEDPLEKEKLEKEKADKEKKDKAEKAEKDPSIDPKYREKLLRITIGMIDDPKGVPVMFQDKLPPETKELEVDDAIANKESSNNDYMNYIKKGDIRR